MNTEKTGAFIAELRNGKNMSVADLAQKTGADEKTVRKWESGRKLPSKSEVLVMCECFGVSLNELLSGQRISDVQYEKFAEDNLYDYIEQAHLAGRRTTAGAVSSIIGCTAGVIIVVLCGFVPVGSWVFVLCMVLGFVFLGLSITMAAVMEYSTGGYVCSKCGKYFVPTAGAYIAGPHSLTTRYLKCPHCGAKTWCRKKILK